MPLLYSSPQLWGKHALFKKKDPLHMQAGLVLLRLVGHIGE